MSTRQRRSRRQCKRWSDERDTRTSRGRAGVEDEIGIHVIARVREHATGTSISLRGAGPSSGRKRAAYANGCS